VTPKEERERSNFSLLGFFYPTGGCLFVAEKKICTGLILVLSFPKRVSYIRKRKGYCLIKEIGVRW
jgi:hypothetical protein